MPVVLVPRRPEPWRDKLWDYVRERVEAEVDWPIFEGLSLGGLFNCSRARNEAAGRAGEWEVAVFLDADSVPDFDNLRRAVELAREGGGVVCPQDTFRSLTRDGTRALLAGKATVAKVPKRWDYPNPKSSCVVVSRRAWDLLGGFDERFEGWLGEDAAFYAAAQALVGVERFEGVIWHCWHPRSPEKNPKLPAYQANERLLARYKAARHDADAMRAILGEPGGPLA